MQRPRAVRRVLIHRGWLQLAAFGVVVALVVVAAIAGYLAIFAAAGTFDGDGWAQQLQRAGYRPW